jgi:SAM-dependent methyltransferase
VNAEQYRVMRAVEDRHWWYVGTRAIAHDALRALPLPPDARILDAGCGTGGSWAMLSRFGRVTGVDVADLALEAAQGRGIGPLARATVAQLPFLDASFDLVTSFEVLYHRAVGDDVAALRELRRVLRPGGWLLLRLPAFEWLRGAHDESVHTARRYTRAGLRAKLVEAGLEPTRITHVNGLLLPLAAAKRGAERLTGASGDDLGPTPALAEALFRGALAIERRLLRRRDLPVGVSVMAVARRRLSD